MSRRISENLLERSFYPLWTKEKVRFTDMDANQHVHNSVYAVYLESGRAHMRATLKIPSYCSGRIVQIEMNYLREVRYPAEINIGTAVTSLGRTSVTLTQAIFHNGTCSAVGKTVYVYVHRDTGQKIVIEEELRAILMSAFREE